MIKRKDEGKPVQGSTVELGGQRLGQWGKKRRVVYKIMEGKAEK